MKQTPTNLIALFARRKEMGFALMDKDEIYRYGVKRIRAKGSEGDFAPAVAKSLSPLLEFMGTEGVVVIEHVDASRRPPNPKGDIPQIVKRLVEGVYEVMEIPLSQVKRRLCGDPNVTHQSLVKTIVPRYPVFESQLKDAKPYKARYWEKAIIAVALAEVASLQLKSGEKRERITKGEG